MKILPAFCNFQEIEEQPAYFIEQMWADIGGTLGLYLGMSAVSVIEVIQLVILLGANWCCAKEKKVKSKMAHQDSVTVPAPEIVYPKNI